VQVKIENHGSTRIINLNGRLDMAGAEVVEQSLQELRYENLDKVTIIISFHDVHYISSSGLRVIVAAFNHLDDQGGKMILCGMDIAVMEVFEFAGLTDVFDIKETLHEARQDSGLLN
jgi:anti-sigma B factor antagonist